MGDKTGRNYEQELANIYDGLAESVLEASDEAILEEAFEEWWEGQGFDGDNPSAAIIPADDYSKFDLGFLCYKAGAESGEEVRAVLREAVVRHRVDMTVLVPAMRKAVELGIFPAHNLADVAEKNWQALREIITAALSGRQA